MIKDLLTKWSKVNLFTRPRRFGKSLNMSMLKCFLEIGCNPALFEGLTISGEKQLCEQYMGKFPVISISLKGISGADYWSARSLICSVIGEEALRYSELLSSSRLSVQEKELYRKLINVDPNKPGNFDMPDDVLMRSLRTLSVLAEKHYGKRQLFLLTSMMFRWQRLMIFCLFE